MMEPLKWKIIKLKKHGFQKVIGFSYAAGIWYTSYWGSVQDTWLVKIDCRVPVTNDLLMNQRSYHEPQLSKKSFFKLEQNYHYKTNINRR